MESWTWVTVFYYTSNDTIRRDAICFVPYVEDTEAFYAQMIVDGHYPYGDDPMGGAMMAAVEQEKTVPVEYQNVWITDPAEIETALTTIGLV